MPLGGGNARLLAIDGRPPAAGEQPQTVTHADRPRYFETLGLRVLRGRTFDALDGTPGHDTAIVNQRFVAHALRRDDPIGRRIELMPDGPPPTGAAEPVWMTVVGISPTIRQRNFQERAAGPGRLRPVARPAAPSFAMLIIKTRARCGQPDVTRCARRSAPSIRICRSSAS